MNAWPLQCAHPEAHSAAGDGVWPARRRPAAVSVVFLSAAGKAGWQAARRAIWLAGALACGAALAQDLATRDPLQDEVARQVQRGEEHPEAALAALAELAARTGEQRQTALGRGLVAAAAGREAEAAAALATLSSRPDPLAAADAALVRATQADARGDTTATLEAAQAARLGYQRACQARTDCDYRMRWRAQVLLARHDLRRGLQSSALDHALEAAELARAAGDTPRQALALAVAGDLSGMQGDTATEQRHLAQAMRMARLDGAPLLRSQVLLYQTKVLRRRGDYEGARRTALDGLQLARRAGARQVAAMHLVNLSDALVAAGDPRGALQAVETALHLARPQGNRRLARALAHNGALARVALGQTAAAQKAMQSLLADYHASGARVDEGMALREFADAFANVGDLATALALYHRERELAARIMADNRDAALAELRQRYDRGAQQRRLEQLARENKLIGTQLHNRAAMQRVWIAGALALGLAAVLVALIYRRVRELNRRLAQNHAVLRAQSHRDPLTGLSNRRGLHDAAAARGYDKQFEGALLLVDIDHFKRVNDGYGHAAGDVVLVEVAHRLAEVVRGDDVVVRWGGEEFLVCMPAVDAGHARALAARVLQAVGAEPVPLPDHRALRVTVSVGYGRFPLPPAQLPMSLERAINLTDMALYTAKNQGRNCAVGIGQAQAADAAGLAALEADFDLAWHEGRVTLDIMAGPSAQTNPAQAELELQAG